MEAQQQGESTRCFGMLCEGTLESECGLGAKKSEENEGQGRGVAEREVSERSIRQYKDLKRIHFSVWLRDGDQIVVLRGIT